MPSSKGYKRNYKQEDKYEATPKQIKNREARNSARKRAADAGLVHKGDGLDVDHIKPLIKGGTNKKSNTRVVTVKANRSFPRTKKARMK